VLKFPRFCFIFSCQNSRSAQLLSSHGESRICQIVTRRLLEKQDILQYGLPVMGKSQIKSQVQITNHLQK